jgi:hypothetical protein
VQQALTYTFANSIRTFLMTMLLVGGCLGECSAQANTQAVEYQVKAAFLYKFGNYVDWPERAFERPDSPLVVGIVGADTFADALIQLVAGRMVNGHAVTVRKLRRGESVAGLHILFIGRMDEAGLTELLAASKGRAMLTVTEAENTIPPGSMINFVLVDDKVRFDIALPPAEQGNLKISARLLGVARKVVMGAS